MHFSSVELSDVKASAIPSSKYEAWFSLIFDFVKQPEPINESRSFISFTETVQQLNSKGCSFYYFRLLFFQ